MEKLTKVTSEAQLRPGLLVELRNCMMCGRTERYLLLSRVGQQPFLCDDNTVVIESGWKSAPSAACMPCPSSDGWAHEFLAVENAISEGRLFIVDPFADDAQTTVRRRKLERAR